MTSNVLHSAKIHAGKSQQNAHARCVDLQKTCQIRKLGRGQAQIALSHRLCLDAKWTTNNMRLNLIAMVLPESARWS